MKPSLFYPMLLPSRGWSTPTIEVAAKAGVTVNLAVDPTRIFVKESALLLCIVTCGLSK